MDKRYVQIRRNQYRAKNRYLGINRFYKPNRINPSHYSFFQQIIHIKVFYIIKGLLPISSAAFLKAFLARNKRSLAAITEMPSSAAISLWDLPPKKYFFKIELKVFGNFPKISAIKFLLSIFIAEILGKLP